MPDPKLMQLMQGGAGKTGAGAPPPAPGAPPGGAPVGAPMTTPQPNEGEQQAAAVDISMAMDLMEKSLSSYGTESEQGQAIHKALGALVKSFGKKNDKAKELVPAELMQLMSSLPQGQGGTPEMKGAGAPPAAAAPPPAMAA